MRPSHPTSVHITVSAVSHGYGDRPLLDAVDLVIADGERIAVVGENGAGKSTLLRLLAGEEQPDAGAVAVHGRASRLAQTPDGAVTVGGLLAAARGSNERRRRSTRERRRPRPRGHCA